MNHVSIAIIRHKPKDKYEYLVLENSGEFSFFHRKDLAIGGQFEYTNFKEVVTDYFGLPEYLERNGTKIPVDFATRPSLFKLSKEDPYATAYTYELSAPYLSAINKNIATSTDNKWKAVRWLSEEELLNKKWKTAQRFLFERESSFNPPNLTNDYRANLRKIAEAKKNGKLVIFAGAGVSIDSGVPGWGELTRALAGDLTTQEKDFKKIAQQYYKERGENEYHQRVRQILKYEHTRFNPIHRIITEINPLHIITTNYDTHFEQVLDQKGLPFSVIRADLDLPYSKGSKLYVKMHGDFELRNIVLKKLDYDTYESKFSLIQSLVRETFASKLILFIGFSFDDSNLRFILKSVSKILKKSIQPPYLFFNSRDSKKEINEDRKKLKPHNIRVLHFEKAITEYFERVKSEEDAESLKQLGPLGQEVYKFLKVVQEFEPISDSLETMEMPNQFVESLERFSELGAIPLDVLVQVSPFKLKQQPKNSYRANAELSWREPHRLETLNEEFLSFLDSLTDDARHLPFLTYADDNVSPEEQRRNRAFKLLWTSGIETISRSGDTSAAHITLFPVNKPDQSCSCPRCLYTAYKIGELFRALNSVSAQGLCEKDFNDAGLFEAYGFLKTGQLAKAFYTLEDVRRQSIRLNRHVTHFIAAYNQVRLRRFINSTYESEYPPTERETILRKISRIDLHELVHALPVATEIRECMLYILDDRIQQQVFPQMEDVFGEILTTYSRYQKPGFTSSGPFYWASIHMHFQMAWNFYNKNLLFSDEYYSFTKMALMYLEATLASHTTAMHYGQRLLHIPDFFNVIAIQYGETKELNELFQKYNTQPIDQKHINETLIRFENFLESGYDYSNILGERASRQVTHYASTESSTFFRSRTLRTFNNFMVVLKYASLAKSQLARITPKLLNFLSWSELFGFHNSLEHLMSFITHYINDFDDNQIQKLMHYILSDNIWTEAPLRSFCNALISKKKADGIFSDDVYQKLIRRTEKRQSWPMHLRDTIPVYMLLKSTEREKLSEEVSNYVRDSPDQSWDFFLKAYWWRMWTPETHKTLTTSFLEQVIQSAPNFPTYSVSDQGTPDGESFAAWNEMMAAIHIIYSQKLLDSEVAEKLHRAVKDPIFKWILKPRTFDYLTFESNWILVFRSQEIVAELKTIPALNGAILKGLHKNYNTKAIKVFHKEFYIPMDNSGSGVTT